MSENLRDRLNEERVVVLPPGSAAEQISAILDRPDADAFIAAIDPPVLHHLIVAAGWEEAIDLIPYVSPYQLQLCIDLDSWKNEAFVSRALEPWLAAVLSETDDVKFVSVSRELDPEILAMFFKENLRVGEMSEEGDVPDAFYHLQVETSPDGVYGLVYPDDEVRADLLRGIIRRLYELDRVLAWTLLEACRWELMSPMEHEALRWRNSRLEEYGYVSRDEAFEIYHVLPPTFLRKSVETNTYDRKIGLHAKADNLPVVASLENESQFFFFRAMELIKDTELQGRLTIEFVTLQNRAAIAEGVNPGDIQKARSTVERTAGYLSLGLSFISRDDLEKAAEYLAIVKLVDVFRAGFTAVATVGKNASKLRHRPTLTLVDGEPYSLLSDEDTLLFKHLIQTRPELGKVEGIEVFREQKQLDYAAYRVGIIALKQLVIFKALNLTPLSLSKIAYDDNVRSTPDVITFDFIQRTAIAQILTEGASLFAPLSDKQIESLPSILRNKAWGKDPIGYFERMTGEVVIAIPAGMICLVSNWFNQSLAVLEEEFSGISNIENAEYFASIVLV